MPTEQVLRISPYHLGKLTQKLVEMLAKETFEKVGWRDFCLHTASVEPCSHSPIELLWEIHETIVGTVSYRGKMILFDMCFDDQLNLMRFETHPDINKVKT